jgi:hypothetical protein
VSEVWATGNCAGGNSTRADPAGDSGHTGRHRCASSIWRLNPNTAFTHNYPQQRVVSRARVITVLDKTLPAELTSCVGITTVYEQETDYTAGQYVYSSRYAVRALDDIRAFEVRFLIFNIWGRHVQTLTATEIADVSANDVRQCDGKWNLFSENEACEHYASIAYLATIRTGTGQVLEADIEPVIAEAKQLSSKFTDSDLEPTPRPR